MASQKGIGRLVQIGVAKEATRGTLPASATYWNPFTELTIDEKKEFAVDEQSYGIIEDNQNLTQVKRFVQGSLSGNVPDQTIGLILYAIFGAHAVATHSGETVVYDHTFTIGESAQHQSLSFYLHDPLSAQDYTYSNGVIEKFELTAELKKFVSFAASLKAKTGVTHSSFSPSTTTENRFVPQYLTAKFASAYSTITGGGGTTVALKNLKVTINGNVEDQEVLGSVDPADFLNKEFMIEGQFDAIWENESDFKTAFMGPTAQAMRLDFKNTDVTIGSASNPEIILDLPKCTFQELSRPFKVKDLVYQTIKFRASYSVTDTLMAKLVLTNTVATY